MENQPFTPPRPKVSGHWTFRFPSWFYAFPPVLITALFYLPVLGNAFVNWDDPETILNNPHLHQIDGSSIYWMFTTFDNGNWTPLTWLTLALDYALGGTKPAGYHFTNLLLHVFNTFLVFYLTLRIAALSRPSSLAAASGWKTPFGISTALLAALLFGLHPLHVESVAWATERKDVLCGFFYLLSTIFYLDYHGLPESGSRKIYWSFLFFLAALMSKPMAVTLPAALLILDFWPLRRWNHGVAKVMAEKIPFVIVSVLDGLLAIRAQGHAAYVMAGDIPPLPKVLNAFHSIVFYLGKIVLPIDLSPLYPFPHSLDWNFYFWGVASVFFCLVVTALSYGVRKRFPQIGAAWLYYLVTLAPVLGFLQVGAQASADRYTYLPSLSLFMFLSTWLCLLFEKKQALFLLCSVVLVVLLGVKTVNQIGVWKDSITLWETAIHYYPEDSPQFAHKNLATAYQVAGRTKEALAEYNKAAAMAPPDPSVLSNRATILFDMGDKDGALKDLKRALDLNPDFTPAHKNLALIYKRLGMEQEAALEYREVLRIQGGN